jgi:hypothetical protein
LYLELRTARDLYETQLRSELTRRLGVSWRRLNGAWADLRGIDPVVNRAFSRRSAEIEEALESSGRSGPQAARIASAKTRPAKDLATPYEQLVVAWRERAYALGLSDSRVIAVTGRSHATSVIPGAGLDGEQRALESWIERALGDHGVVARDGFCRRSDLVRSRCASLPSGGEVAQVERDVDELVGGGRVICVPVSPQPVHPRLKLHSGRSIPGGGDEQLYTTPAVLEINERLRRVAHANPEAVQILSYAVGDHLGALDALSDASSRFGAAVSAVAPGRGIAARFESVTGVDSAALADARASGFEPGLVLVPEAQCLGPWDLSSVVESSLAVGARVLLVAPSLSLETRHSAAAALAPHLARWSYEGADEARDKHRGEARPRDRYCFAGREVLVASSCREARETLVEQWLQGRAEGRSPVVVAAEDAVVRALRDAVQDAGGSPDEVIEAGRLADRRSVPGVEVPLLVLGALPKGCRDVPPEACVHVTVVSPRDSGSQRLGRAAEIARPGYLVSELGPLPSRLPDRRAWRAGAAALEDFRLKWSIGDSLHALGDRALLRSLEPAALSDLAETRREIRTTLRAHARTTPALGRQNLEVPSRSR